MTHNLRQIVTAPLWGAVLMAVACGGGDSATSGPQQNDPPQGQNEISVGDNFYAPNAKTVATGTTITWTWDGSNPHTVTFDAGGPNSVVKSNGTFNRTFAAAGQFTYFCTVHGRAIMSGTVTVQ